MKNSTVDTRMFNFLYSEVAEPEFQFVKIEPGAEKSRFFVNGDVPAVGDLVDIVCVKNDQGGLVLQFRTRREPS